MPIIACKRCKAKKLKCDERPRICFNCEKTNSECISVDARSRREFARGYIEDLQSKIQQLNAVVQAQASTSGNTKHSDASLSSVSPVAQSTYHGEGSSISVARLIEASLVPKAFNAKLADVVLQPGMLEGQNSSDDVMPAGWPSREVAQQLLNSYLDGTHQLHPFLQRSSLVSELEMVCHSEVPVPSSILFRLFMTFAIGAIPLFRAGIHQVPAMSYYVSAMQHAQIALGLGGQMEHIQAHLLVLMFSLQHDIGIGSKWDLSRVAMRICIENQYHRRPTRQLEPMIEQMQRRVFWACYISDRHSSSVLGRPVALSDQDIEVEVPIDADDDLVEFGRTEFQMLRGLSEVSAQLRQISLRQITSSITATVYRKPATHNVESLQSDVNGLDVRLNKWRNSFPILTHHRSAYETTQWRDLNYFREKLKCYRPLAILSKGDTICSSMAACQEAAVQIVELYGALRTSAKLVLNWTCVHDMMSAGFTLLYCGLNNADITRKQEVLSTTSAVLETLSHIAETWPSVNRHVSVFNALARQVTETMCPAEPGTVHTDVEAGGMANDGLLAGFYGAGPRMDFDAGHQADVWDAAMVAFLDEPSNIGNIDWGAVDWGTVDWEAMALIDGEHNFGA